MASRSACLGPPCDSASLQPNPRPGTPPQESKVSSLVGCLAGWSGSRVVVHDKPGLLDLDQVQERRRTSVTRGGGSAISSTWHRSAGHEDGRESRWACSCPGSVARETHVWQPGDRVSSKEIIKVRGGGGQYAFPNYLLITYVK